jgi:hypothetical protein
MVCSHCHQPGHTYRTCPTITEQQKKEISDRIKAEKEARLQRRQQRQQRQQQQVQQQQVQQQQVQQFVKQNYILSNPMDYEVVLYWGLKDSFNVKRFGYCSSHSSFDFSCIKDIHRIVIIPFMEVQDGQDAFKKLTIQPSGHTPGVPKKYFTVFNMKMMDFDGTDIVIDKEYKPPKTELDQWKECALKSRFLLDQIHKMTGGAKSEQFSNIEPFIDMVQDISIPETCTEIDKERAGIPSTFTNIT